jgi:peroxiredoxin (alkyl hydroperoxide reductase subunit C)
MSTTTVGNIIDFSAPTVGSVVSLPAPDFCAAAVLGSGDIIANFQLSEAIKDKYALLVFYPLDFTFVCPSELIALDHRLDEFKKRGVEVIGISIDSQFTHAAWRNTPIEKGGIGQVSYTLVADVSHHIMQAYGVEHPQAKVALRGAFVIDNHGIVRSQIVNDLPLGRNIDEFLRLFDALQHHQQYGEVCPAGWNKGNPAIKPTADGIATYLSGNAGEL